MRTNTEILNSPHQLLQPLEKQVVYCLQIAATQMPCPMCAIKVSQIQASGKELDAFNAGDHSKEVFTCPNCKTELLEVVPFFGPVYEWARKHPYVPPGTGGG